MTIGPALAATTVVAAVASAVLGTRPHPATAAPGAGGWRRHPGTWLGVVVAAFLANQVLFTAYVEQAWDGDVTPVARWFPGGWYDLADLGRVADLVPGGDALSVSVLRVQAGLELPFVVLAYLLVCRWFDADVFRRVVRLRWLVSGAWTVAFCLVETAFDNPWTDDDIVVRVVSALVVTPLLVRLAPGSATTPRLLPFALSAAALGGLVLVAYDSVLLYNLAHVPRLVPVALGCTVVLAAARWWAARGSRSHGVTHRAAVGSLGWFLVLFAAPSLPLRYGLGFGARLAALVVGVALVGWALRLGWDTSVGQLLVVAGIGAVVAAPVLVLAPGLRETRLLAAAAAFVLSASVAASLVDRSRGDLGEPRPAQPAR